MNTNTPDDYAWLDDILFDPQIYYTLNAEGEFVRTGLPTEITKAAIRAKIEEMKK